MRAEVVNGRAGERRIVGASFGGGKRGMKKAGRGDGICSVVVSLGICDPQHPAAERPVSLLQLEVSQIWLMRWSGGGVV